METAIEFVLLYATITIVSLILMIATFISYRRFQNKKLLCISLVLFILFIRGVLLSIGAFNHQMLEITSSNYIWIFDLIIVALLYLTYAIKK